MEKKMLAYVYKGAGKLAIERKPVPAAKENTAVIKMLASSICGTDFMDIHARERQNYARRDGRT